MADVAVIRQRRQVTLPPFFDWVETGSVVDIQSSDGSILIRPKTTNKKKDFDWDKFERKIAISRSFKGEKGNLSAMIAEDRKSH
jgi:hypothetical protein